MSNTFHNNAAVIALILLAIAFLIGTMTLGELLALGLVIGFFWWLGRRSLKSLDRGLALEIAKLRSTEAECGKTGQPEELKN